MILIDRKQVVRDADELVKKAKSLLAMQAISLADIRTTFQSLADAYRKWEYTRKGASDADKLAAVVAYDLSVELAFCVVSDNRDAFRRHGSAVRRSPWRAVD